MSPPDRLLPKYAQMSAEALQRHQAERDRDRRPRRAESLIT
jgi:hypothetical protein